VASRRREAKNAARAAGAALAKSLAAVKTLKAEMATQRYVVAAATRGLDQARLDLSRTLVKAPVAGIVAQRNVDAGKYLEAGQPFLSLVETRNVWVEANFKETQMQRLRIGEPVAIEVDAYPGVTFRGHIQSFQPGTGANFSILPPENATGNFVKIVQRVPVKIALDSPFDSVHPLLPGLSVIPEVDVQRGR
jgi:membrane fusion protein (multidrug efflux system)